MSDHDPLCTEHDSYGEPDECPECEAIARVRADEVERRFGWVTQEDARAWFRADLRAKVEGLPVQVVNMQAVPGQPDDFREAVLLSDVLALLPEVSE